MLAVCAGAEGGLDTVVEALLGELADGRDDAMRLIERSGLMEVFWKQVGNAYGYQPDEPDFEDFAITLFQSAYLRALGEDGKLNAEALLVFRRWKNNRHWEEAFETLAARYQGPAEDPGRSVQARFPVGYGGRPFRGNRSPRHPTACSCDVDPDRERIRGAEMGP